MLLQGMQWEIQVRRLMIAFNMILVTCDMLMTKQTQTPPFSLVARLPGMLSNTLTGNLVPAINWDSAPPGNIK
jgi:hypothetical protein